MLHRPSFSPRCVSTTSLEPTDRLFVPRMIEGIGFADLPQLLPRLVLRGILPAHLLFAPKQMQETIQSLAQGNVLLRKRERPGAREELQRLCPVLNRHVVPDTPVVLKAEDIV